MTAVLLGVSDFAEAIGVSSYTVRRLLEKGQVKSVNVGARRLIPTSELERVIAQGVGKPRERSAQTFAKGSSGPSEPKGSCE